MRNFLLPLLLLGTSLAAPPGGAQTTSAEIGRMKEVVGEATVLRGERSIPASPGLVLRAEDTVRTGPDGQLGITFVDNTRFALGPDTEIRLDTFVFDTSTHAGKFVSSIKAGRLSVISGRIAKHEDDAMQVRTPTRILGVRGTRFLVKVAR